MTRLGSGPLDLRHQGHERIIASYLLETGDGPALFDCGPSSCLPELRARLGELGLEVGDLRHLVLSHIHLDHAGAAGTLVRENPGLRVHVSPVGAPHLVDPSRLEASARRLYGATFDPLWGELAPVPAGNVRETGERVLGMECFRAPGHASHHVCYLDAEGTLLAGDAAGVRIQPSRYVFPPTPPPEVDVEAWLDTIEEIRRRRPRRLALVHFGLADDVDRHLDRLREKLVEWSELVRDGADARAFAAAGHRDLAPEDEDLYERAMPLGQSYLGLRRYWDKAAAPSSSTAAR